MGSTPPSLTAPTDGAVELVALAADGPEKGMN